MSVALNQIIRSLKRIDGLIANTEDHISVTEKSTYYKVFSTETERQSDLAKLNASLKELLHEKFGILESLNRQSSFDMMAISSYEQKVTLLKTVSHV